jgi:hypothetical protein
MAGMTDVADAAARELSGITERTSDTCRACAARAMGTVALLEGRYEDACDSMRTAVALYGNVTLPFELATARLGLAAAATALGKVHTAKLERDAALATYQDAGAIPSGTARLWLDRVAELN